MKAPREHITIFRIELDMSAVASALWVPEEVARKVLGDGRVASRWAEYWGSQAGGVTQAENTNEAWRDASVSVSSATLGISNKTLTAGNGVKFQASKFVGSGRSATVDDLVNSLDMTELVHVVDVTDVPTVDIVTVHTKYLRQEVRAGRLGLSGWKKKAFYEFIDRTYETRIVVVHP